MSRAESTKYGTKSLLAAVALPVSLMLSGCIYESPSRAEDYDTYRSPCAGYTSPCAAIRSMRLLRTATRKSRPKCVTSRRRHPLLWSTNETCVHTDDGWKHATMDGAGCRRIDRPAGSLTRSGIGKTRTRDGAGLLKSGKRTGASSPITTADGIANQHLAGSGFPAPCGRRPGLPGARRWILRVVSASSAMRGSCRGRYGGHRSLLPCRAVCLLRRKIHHGAASLPARGIPQYPDHQSHHEHHEYHNREQPDRQSGRARPRSGAAKRPADCTGAAGGSQQPGGCPASSQPGQAGGLCPTGGSQRCTGRG